MNVIGIKDMLFTQLDRSAMPINLILIENVGILGKATLSKLVF